MAVSSTSKRPPQPSSDDGLEQTPEEDKVWDVKCILQQKGKRYLVDWEGEDPATGKPWPPSWVHRDDCTPALIDEWKEAQKEKKRKRKSRASKSGSTRGGSVASGSTRGSVKPAVSIISRVKLNLSPVASRASPVHRKDSRITSTTSDEDDEEQEAPPRKKRKQDHSEEGPSSKASQSRTSALLDSEPKGKGKAKAASNVVSARSSNGKGKEKAVSIPVDDDEEAEEDEALVNQLTQSQPKSPTRSPRQPYVFGPKSRWKRQSPGSLASPSVHKTPAVPTGPPKKRKFVEIPINDDEGSGIEEIPPPPAPRPKAMTATYKVGPPKGAPKAHIPTPEDSEEEEIVVPRRDRLKARERKLKLKDTVQPADGDSDSELRPIFSWRQGKPNGRQVENQTAKVGPPKPTATSKVKEPPRKEARGQADKEQEEDDSQPLSYISQESPKKRAAAAPEPAWEDEVEEQPKKSGTEPKRAAPPGDSWMLESQVGVDHFSFEETDPLAQNPNHVYPDTDPLVTIALPDDDQEEPEEQEVQVVEPPQQPSSQGKEKGSSQRSGDTSKGTIIPDSQGSKLVRSQSNPADGMTPGQVLPTRARTALDENEMGNAARFRQSLAGPSVSTRLLKPVPAISPSKFKPYLAGSATQDEDPIESPSRPSANQKQGLNIPSTNNSNSTQESERTDFSGNRVRERDWASAGLKGTPAAEKTRMPLNEFLKTTTTTVTVTTTNDIAADILKSKSYRRSREALTDGDPFPDKDVQLVAKAPSPSPRTDRAVSPIPQPEPAPPIPVAAPQDADLKREIEDLRAQLAARDAQFAFSESQVAGLQSQLSTVEAEKREVLYKDYALNEEVRQLQKANRKISAENERLHAQVKSIASDLSATHLAQVKQIKQQADQHAFQARTILEQARRTGIRLQIDDGADSMPVSADEVRRRAADWARARREKEQAEEALRDLKEKAEEREQVLLELRGEEELLRKRAVKLRKAAEAENKILREELEALKKAAEAVPQDAEQLGQTEEADPNAEQAPGDAPVEEPTTAPEGNPSLVPASSQPELYKCMVTEEGYECRAIFPSRDAVVHHFYDKHTHPSDLPATQISEERAVSLPLET